MLEVIKREGIYFWYYFSIQFEQIFRYWVFGIIMGSIISVFGKAKIHALLFQIKRRNIGLLGLLPASLIGVISPLCLYGTLPIAASFSEKGIREDWLAAFMMSSILLNPQLMVYSAALGKTMLMIRIAISIICGVLAGLLVHFFFKKESFFNFKGFQKPVNRDTDPNILVRLLKSIGRNIRTTGLYFLVGIALAAIFQRYVPADGFAKLFGSGNRGFGLLLAATIGVPLYMCGGGTIPLLQAWLDHGMSMGSAAAFMITGPATKIVNLGAIKIVLGMRHFVFYLAFTMLFALVSGFLVNWIN
jgi:uncharacterized membrane protein YraQ (UPF0718 family)